MATHNQTTSNKHLNKWIIAVIIFNVTLAIIIASLN